MRSPAESGGGGAPFAKLVTIGQTLVAAFASDPRQCRRQVRNFKTQELEWKDEEKTKPLLEEVMHFVAMPGTTAGVGEREALNPIQPGTHVRYSVRGHKWGQVLDARKALPGEDGYPAGKTCPGDVYQITLIGWSAETKNVAAAEKAGFNVVDGRIVLRDQDEKDRYVLAQSRTGGNTNPAVDFDITIRRPTADEREWEHAADELYMARPWDTKAAPAPLDDDDEDPF